MRERREKVKRGVRAKAFVKRKTCGLIKHFFIAAVQTAACCFAGSRVMFLACSHSSPLRRVLVPLGAGLLVLSFSPMLRRKRRTAQR